MNRAPAKSLSVTATFVPRSVETFATCFAGYDREQMRDDIVYLAINSFWEDVEITLPRQYGGNWYLSVNTFGDGRGRYCYGQGEEIRIDGSFVMRPRSVAVFVRREY